MRIDTVNIQKAAQTALVQEAQSAHFYTQQGASRYSDTVKTGPNKGKECAVNLRHARKENLYPSITHIHKCLSEKALTYYRESHLLAAAENLTKGPDETLVDYYHRVNIEARKDSMNAAQTGTNVPAGVGCAARLICKQWFTRGSQPVNTRWVANTSWRRTTRTRARWASGKTRRTSPLRRRSTSADG